MGVLGKYGGSALKYYGSILASAYQGVSTQDMWIAIHSSAAQYGLSSPQTQPPDVSTIRKFANQIVAGAQAFAAASETDSITPDMMAVAPYTSRDLNAIAVTPVYQVRYKNTVQADDGTVTSVWNTSVFTASDMPGTVGGLLDAVNADAQELAAQGSDSSSTTPRGVSLSTSDHEITLV
jgi:hypothetical protein